MQDAGANSSDALPYNSPERMDRLIRESGQLRLSRHSSKSTILTKMARMFDRNKFKEHSECIICLEEFKPADRVTPLPCDIRHYFHSKCIEQWSKQQKSCPLCNTPFTIKELSDYDKKYSLLCAKDFNRPQEEVKEPYI